MIALSRRQLLLGGAALGGAALLRRGDARAEAVAPPRNLVLVVGYGGWDTTYALDPKPGLAGIDAPAGDVVDMGGIPVFTDASRPNVTAFFERYAPLTSVVNGVQVQSIVHSDCSKRMLTGTASDANPDVGAIAAHELARDMPVPYLVLGQTSYAGPYASLAARAGTANQLGTLLDPYQGYPLGDPAMPNPPVVLDGDEEALVRAHVVAQAQRVQAVRGAVGLSKSRMDDFVASLQRGDDLRSIGALGELDYTRDISIQVALAITAFERGLSWVAQLESGSFDTHDDNSQQTMQWERLFGGVTLLCDELAARPGRNAGSTMLDETIVAVVSEMGRTPKLNMNAGKDHWPVTSALLVGGGIAGGRVVGATSDELGALGIDLQSGEASEDGTQLQYGNFAAGLLAAVGVDPALYLPNAEPLDAVRA